MINWLADLWATLMKALLIIGFCLTPPSIFYVIFVRPYYAAKAKTHFGDDSHVSFYLVVAFLSAVVGLLFYGAAATLWERRRKRNLRALP